MSGLLQCIQSFVYHPHPLCQDIFYLRPVSALTSHFVQPQSPSALVSHHPLSDVFSAYTMSSYCHYRVALMKTKQTENDVVMTVIPAHALGQVIRAGVFAIQGCARTLWRSLCMLKERVICFCCCKLSAVCIKNKCVFMCVEQL